MTATNRDELLAAVERSPRAVAAHDRDAWVQVFTADGRVEDPVGSSPHLGHDQIYRFYDTFIGPREIKFHRDLDIVNGRSVKHPRFHAHLVTCDRCALRPGVERSTLPRLRPVGCGPGGA